MCRRTECKQCDRPTYAGCGSHIEQVLGDVPVDERCQCDRSAMAAPARSRSWFGRSRA